MMAQEGEEVVEEEIEELAEGETEESGDSQEDIALARSRGHIDEETFRGGKHGNARWVSAKEFNTRYDQVMPAVRNENKKLQIELRTLRAQDTERAAELKAIKASLKAVEDAQSEDVADRVAAATEDLESEIEAASEAGDHKRVAKLTSQLVKLEVAQKTASKTAVVEEPAKAAAETPHPSYVAWAADKPWLDDKTDPRFKLMEKAVRATYVEYGNQIKGEEFFEALDVEYAKLNKPSRSADNRVTGGGTGARGSAAGETAGWDDLPSEAKRVCREGVEKYVGKGKRYETEASWRKAYVKMYNEG